jgi:hypothetical protein
VGKRKRTVKLVEAAAAGVLQPEASLLFQGLEFMVSGLGFWDFGCGLMVWGYGVWGLGIRVKRLGFRFSAKCLCLLQPEASLLFQSLCFTGVPRRART